jgi:2-aminoadipate transaminase
VASRPGILSFALGLPAAEMFPINQLTEAALKVLSEEPRVLQYSPPPLQLKEQIVELMEWRGVRCRAEQIFITAGAQQGMSLLARLLLDPGGQVLIEQYAYTGLLQIIEPYQPEILTVGTDYETGMALDEVEALLAGGARPAFIYTVTEGHNPLGVSMSREKREGLVRIAARYKVPIIEDDAYGFLSYDGMERPPMRAYDERWVFYVGSFSKILAPNLRVGWVVLPEPLIEKLSIIKEASDINTVTFSQRVIAAYLEMGGVQEQLERLRGEYALRRNTMLAALRRWFPDEARWNHPVSGFFIWVELPERVDTGELLRLAIEQEQIAYVPGHAFEVGGSRRAANCMRLNFTNCQPQKIEQGIAALGRMVKAALA